MDVPARAIQDARMRSLLPVALVLLPHLVVAQSVSLQDNALQDWTRLKDTVMKIAAAMPEDNFGYRATPPERTWGEQFLHVAEANIVQMGRLGSTVPPPAYDMKETSPAAITHPRGLVRLRHRSAEGADRPEHARAGGVHSIRSLHGCVNEGTSRVLRDRPHVGHLRPDGRLPPAQRDHAARQSAVLTRGILSGDLANPH